MTRSRFFATKNLVRLALLASIASVLMYFEFPIPFLAPDFYRMDFSEVPVLIAGFMMGCVLVLPPVLFVRCKPSKRMLVVGSAIGVLALMLAAAVLNYFLLIPLYATLFNVPIEVYVNAGHALNAHVVDLKALIVLCVLPFNFIKGSLVTLLSGALFLRIGDQLNRY